MLKVSPPGFARTNTVYSPWVPFLLVVQEAPEHLVVLVIPAGKHQGKGILEGEGGGGGGERGIPAGGPPQGQGNIGGGGGDTSLWAPTGKHQGQGNIGGEGGRGYQLVGPHMKTSRILRGKGGGGEGWKGKPAGGPHYVNKSTTK